MAESSSELLSDDNDTKTTENTKGKRSTTAETPTKTPKQTNVELRGTIYAIADMYNKSYYSLW